MIIIEAYVISQALVATAGICLSAPAWVVFAPTIVLCLGIATFVVIPPEWWEEEL